MMGAVLLRLAYLGVTSAFAILRLLPMCNRDKDIEILALRHQINVLERQLGNEKVRFDGRDRAFLAALLHRLPRDVLRRLRLPVSPDTVLRWHRDHGPRGRRLPGSVHDPHRDGTFPAMLEVILAEAGIGVVLSGIRMPRMNSIIERWRQTCRRESLDRTLIWNQRHLLHALHEFERFYNGHRPHRGIANARVACGGRRSGQDGPPRRTTT
jgi:hypothetical protein